MDDAPGAPARLRSTLFAVARYAGEDGRGAYPAAAEVARITGKSESQAARDVAALVRLGLLLPGDQSLVAKIRADRRPKVYDLPMPRGASGRTPSGDSRGASRRDPSGDSRGASGRTPSRGSRVASGDGTGRMARPHGAHLDADKESLKRSRTSPARVREAAAEIIRAAYPDATDDEIEIITKDRINRGARSPEAVIAREVDRGELRLPCDRDGPGRHSNACRDGDPRGCGVEWCACRCHTEPKPATPAEPGEPDEEFPF
jgi:hypothetical protein